MQTSFITILVVCSYLAMNSAFHLQPRIIHGDTARYGQFPFFAFLEIEEGENMYDGCGATLISDEWLLSAAHCLAKAKRLLVKLGTSQMEFFFEADYVVIPVEKENIHIYPGYIEQSLWHDIGLIHLPKRVKISSTIKPVQMPRTCDSTENIAVIAMGHGSMKVGSFFAPELQFATMKTLPIKECRKALPVILFRTSVICASNPERNQTVFDGDSGGALVRQSDNTLIGITSFVHSVKYDDGSPQGFTNVYSYLDWIQNMTGIDLPTC